MIYVPKRKKATRIHTMKILARIAIALLYPGEPSWVRLTKTGIAPSGFTIENSAVNVPINNSITERIYT